MERKYTKGIVNSMLNGQFVQFAFIWLSLPPSDEITQSWPDYSHHDCSVFLCTGCKGYRSLNRLYTTCMRSSVTFIVLWNPTPNKNSIVRTLPSDTLIMGQSNPPSLNHIHRRKRSRKKEGKGRRRNKQEGRKRSMQTRHQRVMSVRSAHK